MNTNLRSPQQIGSILLQNFSKVSEKKPISDRLIYGHPYMDRESITETIQNGKRFAEKFNQEQNKKSDWIHQMNSDYRREILERPHTPEQRIQFDIFKKKHKLAKASPMAYNTKVLEFNREHGTHFLLRAYPTLRNEIAVTFSHLVMFFAAQLKDYIGWKKRAGITTAGSLPRLRTNSEALRRFKTDGVKQCPYKNEAILQHVHNLVAAGILVNYKSHGRNKGFSLEINPKILTVKDLRNQKSQKPASQSLRLYKKDKHPHYDSTTRTSEDHVEIKGDATASPGIRNDAEASASATGSHTNTKRNDAKASTSATRAHKNTDRNTQSEETANKKASSEPENFAPNPSIRPELQEQNSPAAENSAFLESRIQEKWGLCRELALDMHVNHVPVDLKRLRMEAKNGTMSQQMFRELLFQEFMKYISRLKKGNQSGAGAFFRAFEELEDKKMVTFTGQFFRKETMVDEFQKWLWMVNNAERWGKKRNWKFLYINAYLDTTKRDAKQVGFWYLEKAWNKNEKQKAQRKAERAKKAAENSKKKKQIKAERVEKYGYRSVKPGTNSRSLSDYEKARIAVRKYLYGKISGDALWRYVEDNLNSSIRNGLQKLIAAEAENLRKYNA